MEDFCFTCNSFRSVEKIGTYEYEGKEYPIVLCKYCRAWGTRRKNKEQNNEKN